MFCLLPILREVSVEDGGHNVTHDAAMLLEARSKKWTEVGYTIPCLFQVNPCFLSYAFFFFSLNQYFPVYSSISDRRLKC